MAGADPDLVKKYRREFEYGPLSKPIGFYTWSEKLLDLFRFMRFFMQEIGDPELCLELSRSVVRTEKLRQDYEASIAFFEGLTNPRHSMGLDDVYRGKEPKAMIRPSPRGRGPSIWPPSTSREVLLFESIFAIGPCPPEFRLMEEFIKRIKKGEVDLKPREKDGWYQYQAFALQAFLLPAEGLPSQKLLLTKKYKARLEEAFAALVTKRRETHVRQLAEAEATAPGPPEIPFKPIMRLEPNPLFYLRTARAYVFLRNFLLARMGEETLRRMHGLKDEGRREKNLLEELDWMITFFYGCYLVCCDDIGLRLDFMEGELPMDDRVSAKATAMNWLNDFKHDPDLAVDTRVAVPILRNPDGSRKVWATVGVRMAKLWVDFERGHCPMIRRMGETEWIQPRSTSGTLYHIPVDSFVEVFNPHGWIPNRMELRDICDRMQTQDEIIAALAAGK